MTDMTSPKRTELLNFLHRGPNKINVELGDSCIPRSKRNYYGSYVQRRISMGISGVVELSSRRSMSPKRIMRNLIVLALSFMFVFTGFFALQNLQSTFNSEGGLGVLSLVCVYGAMTMSCFFGPTLIYKTSAKWTVAVSFIFFTAYTGANFYPADFSLLPASVILGLCLGPLFCAQSSCIMTAASKYAFLMDDLRERVVNRFIRIFNVIFYSSQVWGNLISALILTYHGEVIPTMKNSTRVAIPCGSNDCGIFADPNTTIVKVVNVSSNSMFMLYSICFGCGVMGIALSTTLLGNMDLQLYQDTSVNLTPVYIIERTCKILRDPRLFLILPLVLFMGLEEAFMIADFTKVLAGFEEETLLSLK